MSLPVRIRGLDHVVLRARNAELLVDFYTRILGCAIERRLDAGLVQLRAGASLIDIVDVNSRLGIAGGAGPGREGRNLDHFCLQVDGFDQDKLLQYFETHQVDCEPAARVYGALGFGPAVYVKDPEGNTVELKSAAVDEPG